MTIVVAQQGGEAASARISIYAGGKLEGAIGPGESIAVKAQASPCEIQARCGSYQCQYIAKHDEQLAIRWSLSARRMDIAPLK